MNKRILSILLCLMLVASLLVMAVPVSAAPTDVLLKVTADKTEAKPGDTITYTITMGPIDALGFFDMCLEVPAGLTYVPNSGKVADGLKETLGFDYVAFTEVSRFINGYSIKDYSSETDTVIATFQCTVDEDATGVLTMGLEEDAFTFGTIADINGDDLPHTCVIDDVTVVTDEPTEAPATEAPVTEAPATEAPATEAPATEAPVTEAPTEKPAPVLEFVPQVDPTATEPGVAAHYVDPETGKKYADATGAVEVTDEDLYIAPLGVPTEAPATEAPVTEAPATEAPATEAPATEAPATEAPATEAPATEAPATEAPATETPETEAIPTEADEPATEVPTEAYAETQPVTEAEAIVATEAATTAATKDSATKDAATKTTATKTTATSPKTGDSTHMYLWMLIMLASLAGACAVLYTAKRKGIFTK